jgi:hypothetical protein
MTPPYEEVVDRPIQEIAGASHRIGWMLLIWTTSVARLAIVALGVRMLTNLAGLTE